ncbi:unnamed protein product [Phytophthora fragariaefolia]|uniref:Unnamed protein product n=1 Tax=Phytophthora fragariaefolia TaxID=1490495 RepID=A0A9W6YQ48_9STRA|nr:unnamed protein product [Phytophthora fragariaefolia]
MESQAGVLPEHNSDMLAYVSRVLPAEQVVSSKGNVRRGSQLFKLYKASVGVPKPLGTRQIDLEERVKPHITRYAEVLDGTKPGRI